MWAKALHLVWQKLVYIAARTINEGESDSKLAGTISQTQAEIQAKGGKCIAIQCDHYDEQVKMVFDQNS